MEKILLDFIGTLDASFKKLQAEAGSVAGISNLTVSQLHYLDAVHALGEPTLSELADALDITKASVTAGVNKLVKKGYVTKTQSEADKRVFHLSLTDAAQTFLAAKSQALKEYGLFVRAALTQAEAEQFEATLEKLVKHFGQA